MSDTLYLKIDQNVLVERPHVVLKDIGKLTCTNTAIVNKLKTMKVYHFQESSGSKDKNQIVVFSIIKIIELIGEEYPQLKINNLGEKDFILEYMPRQEQKWMMLVKVVLICTLIFFGSAFTIMTFNNDVGVLDVFSQFYEQVMGKKSDGFTVLEVFYSLGLAVGILVFFNHIGRKKVTHDPTPMQVQMRQYEQDVDATFIENSSRKGSSIDVD